MKKIKILLVFLAMIQLVQAKASNQTLDKFQGIYKSGGKSIIDPSFGSFSIENARAFYFLRNFTSEDEVYDIDKGSYGVGEKEAATSLNVGGILKYTSPSFLPKYLPGLNAVVAFWGSYRVNEFFGGDSEDAIGSSLISKTGKNISLLGEAYIQYKNGGILARVGRQVLNTPMLHGYDSRILPTTYEAAIVRYSMKSTSIEAGYIQRMTTFYSTSNALLDYTEVFGEKGLAYFYIKDKSIENLTLKAQFAKPVDEDISSTSKVQKEDYFTAQADYKVKFKNDDYVGVGLHYGQIIYDDDEDSQMLGLQISGRSGMLEGRVFAEDVSGNSFTLPRGGIEYAGFQYGVAAFDPYFAFGTAITAHINNKWQFITGIVKVNADEKDISGRKFHKNITADNFLEHTYELRYLTSYNGSMKPLARVRLNYRNSLATDDGTANTSYDILGFRVYYYFYF